MKKSMNILRFAAVLAAGLAFLACQKVKETYEPATLEEGDRVFFMTEPSGTVKLVKENPTFDIVVGRNSYMSMMDAPLVVSGEALEYFDVPTKVSFAPTENKKTITIKVKDINTVPVNSFFDLKMSVDESLATVYGQPTIAFKIGIELPWITFDTGTMIEGWWGETEPDMPMKYQQISPTMRYCVVEGCWGHDTGEGYPVQDYVWYWNTETNACYVPCQFMGYNSSGNDAYISDKPAFYNWYWNSQEPGKNGSGLEQGTDEWFEWCDARRAAWEGDPFPYYDGAGKFYLGDWGFLVTPGTTNPTGSGFQFGGKQDVYVCSFAADYTISLTYDGIFTSKDDAVYAVGTVTYETKDVNEVALVLVEGKDPEAATEELAKEASDQVLVITAGGTYNVPMPEEAPEGFYTLVALPLNGEGVPQWDYAVYETFGYGNLDPMYLEYTSADFTAGVSKETLFGTEWLAYAASYGGSASDREPVALVTFEDAEDNEAGDDLITCSGLANTTAFEDTFVMEYYNGVIYFLGAQEIGAYSSYAVVASTYSDETDISGNYTMCGAYVGEDMIAFVNNSKSENYYGFAFWAVAGEDIADYLRAREYLMLVPYEAEESAAAPSIRKNNSNKLSVNEVQIPYRYGMDSQRNNFSFNGQTRKDVVAGGRVYGVKANDVVRGTLR